MRQQRQREAQEAVGAHLQQNTGQDHRAGGGRFHMGVGQPGVEREHRHLDGEAQEERPEDPLLDAARKLQAHELGNLEGVKPELAEVLEVQRQDAEQQQDRTGQRVEEEFDGGIEFARAAPHPDDEVHRDQHQLPEDEEQKEIEGDEDADHAHLQEQEHGVVGLDAVLNRVPGRQHSEKTDHGREHQEQQADAVDANVIVDAERRNPVGALGKLEAGRAGLEAPGQRHRHQEPGEGHQVGPDADQGLVRRGQEEQHRQPRQGRRQHESEQVLIHIATASRNTRRTPECQSPRKRHMPARGRSAAGTRGTRASLRRTSQSAPRHR